MYHTGVCNSVKANSQKSFVGHPTIYIYITFNDQVTCYIISKMCLYINTLRHVMLTEWEVTTIIELYHGENKLIFNEMMMRSALY